MARYRVLQRSYVNEQIVEPGEEVEFVGIAGSNLELIGDEQSARTETLVMLQEHARALGLGVDKNHGASRLASMIAEAAQRQTD